KLVVFNSVHGLGVDERSRTRRDNWRNRAHAIDYYREAAYAGAATLLLRQLSNSRHRSHEVRQNLSPTLRLGRLCPNNSFEPTLARRPRTELAHHGSILGPYGVRTCS